jgi:hypothetical protein
MEMEGEQSNEGEPSVGARRRRLTLAPRPWAEARHGGTAPEVSAAVFADSGGSGAAWGEVDGERLAVSEPCSSVGSSSELRSEFAMVTNGSRFWVLDVEDCSDGDSTQGELLVSGGDSRCAAPRGSGGDMFLPEAAASLCSVGVAASNDATAERRSYGQSERVLQAMPVRRRSKAGRPWRGPLPPRRSVQVRSLGDLWVEDRRSGRGVSRARLAEWLEGEGGMVPTGPSPEAEVAAAHRCDPVLNFATEVRVTSRGGGFVSRAGVGRKVAQGSFRFTDGLGLLFLGGGKQVRLPRRPRLLPPRVHCEVAAGVAPMEVWRREGRGGWSSEERRERSFPDGRRQWPRPCAPARGVGPPGRAPVAGGGGAWGGCGCY